MNWNATLNLHWQELLLFLAEITVLVIAGLIAQLIASRSTAVRHAILLGTLLAVAVLPLLIAIVHFAGIAAPLPIGHSAQVFKTLFAGSDQAQPVLSDIHAFATSRWSAISVLAMVWLLGVLWQVMRMIKGMLVASRRTRNRKPILSNLIPQSLALSGLFGHRNPLIFLADAIAVPMAVGYFRPVIVLPSALLDSLCETQLCQVLVHENAHVRRRDALVALFQEILKCVFWFHPLIHLTSRKLDEVREEICDNYVLQTVTAKEYAHTLLSIAELMPKPAGLPFTPALIQSRGLEKRVAGLLYSRRCTMIHLSSKKVAAIGLCFLSSVAVLSCFAGSTKQDQSSDFSHVVRLERPSNPDSITVDEVRGPVDTIIPGNTYEVRGRYKLVSQDKALLAVYVTVEASNPHEPHPDVPNQRMIVEKGEGTFALQFHMWHKGNPHVTFYPAKGGNSFLSTYF
jgi:beta-lactamase regulating signal transducer with metallopeptidase domain